MHFNYCLYIWYWYYAGSYATKPPSQRLHYYRLKFNYGVGINRIQMEELDDKMYIFA
jgi:hypothetical protein